MATAWQHTARLSAKRAHAPTSGNQARCQERHGGAPTSAATYTSASTRPPATARASLASDSGASFVLISRSVVVATHRTAPPPAAGPPAALSSKLAWPPAGRVPGGGGGGGAWVWTPSHREPVSSGVALSKPRPVAQLMYLRGEGAKDSDTILLMLVALPAVWHSARTRTRGASPQKTRGTRVTERCCRYRQGPRRE